MKFTWIALPGVLLLSACSSSQPNAPRPPRIGMPNPAAVYCEQQGGTLMPVQTPTRRAFRLQIAQWRNH